MFLRVDFILILYALARTNFFFKLDCYDVRDDHTITSMVIPTLSHLHQ
jgi:hypothetical protein